MAGEIYCMIAGFFTSVCSCQWGRSVLNMDIWKRGKVLTGYSNISVIILGCLHDEAVSCKVLILRDAGFSVKMITNLNEGGQKSQLLCPCIASMLIIMLHFTTQKGGNQHEISRIASKCVLFTQLSVTWTVAAHSGLRVNSLSLVSPGVCLPGALVVKDPSSNWFRARKRCRNTLGVGVHFKTTSTTFSVFCLFGKDF